MVLSGVLLALALAYALTLLHPGFSIINIRILQIMILSARSSQLTETQSAS